MIDFNATSAEMFYEKIITGDRNYLARAITLLESNKSNDRKKANAILDKCIDPKRQTLRIAITGVPGAGKSTFIESIGETILAEQKKIAVLAIDPSSKKNKGSILGDKTRMQKLASEKNVFIRPSPAGEMLGGVTNVTHESIILVEAAGYDIVMIETVGVGQSETLVDEMCDIFLLLLISGAGDELQGMKRGIMEMADIICINKADGANKAHAEKAKFELKKIFHLMSAPESGNAVEFFSCSALTKASIPEIWQSIKLIYQNNISSGYFTKKRQQQDLLWFRNLLQTELSRKILSDEQIINQILLSETEIKNGNSSPASEVEKILRLIN